MDEMVVPWKEFANDWALRCVADGETDWQLYSQVLRNLISLLNQLAQSVMDRFIAGQPPNALHEFPSPDAESSECVLCFVSDTESLSDFSV